MLKMNGLTTPQVFDFHYVIIAFECECVNQMNINNYILQMATEKIIRKIDCYRFEYECYHSSEMTTI